MTSNPAKISGNPQNKAFHKYTLSDWMNYSPILLLPSEVQIKHINLIIS